MSYIINRTDGSILTEIVDGTIDQTASDLTLVGKNAVTYGEFLNENFVHVLENFANTSSPPNPIQGQLWYDTTEGRLKVYDGTSFKVSGGTIVSASVPTLAQGDIWIDSFRQQLYFNDGVSTILAGPSYTQQQGISGMQTIDVIDTNNFNQTIVMLYVGQVLLGIFSKTEFTPLNPIAGYTGTVKIGFNVSSYAGIKFNVPASSASALVAADGSLKTAENFVSSTEDSPMYGTLSLLNAKPLVLGPNQNNEVRVNSSLFRINSNSINQNFQINTLSSGLSPAFHINAATQSVGIFTDLPTATLDVNGNTVIRGNLTVEGDTTTINTTSISVEDLNITLASGSTTDDYVDAPGITIKGATDKTLNWVAASSESWQSSENFNLVSGKQYHVGGFPVLSQTTLGQTVTSAPGLTSVGILTALQVSNLVFTSSTVSFSNAGITNGDITLTPKGNGVVDVSSARISNLADPVLDADGVNLQTLTTTVELAPLGLSIDSTGLSNGDIISQILNKIYPAPEHTVGTICRVWCFDVPHAKQFIVANPTGSMLEWTGGTVI